MRNRGDEAVFEYTKRFDRADITEKCFRVTDEEIEEAYRNVPAELLAIIRTAAENIREYHKKQLRTSWFETKPDGILLGQKITAISSVGVYVPGGKAAYPSSVLMNIVPAKVAGVERITMMTPVGPDGKSTEHLVAQKEAGE